MDQLKTTLRYLKRIHFWILCPLVALIGIAFWYLAVGKLNEQKDQNLSEISNNYNVAQSVLSLTPHPNPTVAVEMDDLILKTRTEIKEAWQNKTAQQEKVLKWPENLPPQFLRTVEPLRPIERAVPSVDAEELILLSHRQTYRNYIEKELPQLAELAGARWVVGFGDNRTGGVVRRGEQENTLVVWNPENQLNIRKKHFEWSGRGTGGRSDGTPTTLEILYAQEDLWVLRHLMQIIDRTNIGATTRHSAAIRKIISIDIGKAAVKSDVEVEALVVDNDGKGRKAAPVRINPETDVSSISDPAEGRYVDNNYEPLSAEILRQVMQSGEVSPEQAYLAVAKRIPVRLRVSMDQRRINKLLVECANSELTVEVRQLLINKDHTAGRTGPGGGFGGGNSRESFQGKGGRSQNSKGAEPDNFPFDLDVEVYGIVSIYNPVDNAALGLATEETETASATGVRAATSR